MCRRYLALKRWAALSRVSPARVRGEPRDMGKQGQLPLLPRIRSGHYGPEATKG
jgi:hypothetical protein